jgi:hypothetical protein
MPRASNGVYTLPAAGNPVVTGTTISSTWANTTLEDIADAMTDSLSRSGVGGMLAPLLLDDGAVGSPALSFSTDTNTGFYRTGADAMAFTANGANVLGVDTTGITTVVGSVGTPSISFLSDRDTGFYTTAANTIGIAANGTLVTEISTGGIVLRTGVLGVTNGTVGSPGLSFDIDGDTGIYRISANNIGISCGGVNIMTIGAGTSGIILGASGAGQYNIRVNNTTASSASAGAASALPATPVGYLTILVNGSQAAIPYYSGP